SIATNDVVTATHKRAVAATSRTTTRKLRATVAAFATCGHWWKNRVRLTIPTTPTTSLCPSAEKFMPKRILLRDRPSPTLSRLAVHLSASASAAIRRRLRPPLSEASVAARDGDGDRPGDTG